jgi:hypothetical protein
MPECANCGSHVTRDYVRVFTPPDVDIPRVCPECPDRIRDGNSVRQARSSRHTGTDPNGYDPEYGGDGDA